jgi:hypothetical protein
LYDAATYSSVLRDGLVLYVSHDWFSLPPPDDCDADAAGGVRQALVDAARDDGQFRVLDDRFMQIGQGIAVPNTRTPGGAAYVGLFVEAMKASGRVRAALDASGQDGAVVPDAAAQ